MIKNNVSAGQVVKDFNRREILPDETHQVSQGFLNLWRLNNNLIAELLINSDNGVSVPGTIIITGNASYINTVSPQYISDDLINENKLGKKELDIISMTPSQMGKLGGAAKSEAKTNAAKENGKKGGRPKKQQ
jgi:hypothetical protein